ncbi:MAG: hypothetical protein IJH40_00370 [Ruminococcus sp.]|uniref:hypothetical protein n=1 Tax=Ruminococcus sp. TaxID=41978 RepID=UPI002873EDEE|nr:hypothetical protein [Ruminococcus sp.]MBQ3284077.1 hypothetical protein [Ruminococcus sp.]
MSDLKKAWVKTAKSMVLAANDLGVALADSIRVGRDKALEWANSAEESVEVDATEVPAEETADTTKE